MTKAEAVRQFKESLYPNKRFDYWTAQQMWAEWTDFLCKEGHITQHQYDTWETPFPYGSHVTVTSQKTLVID